MKIKWTTWIMRSVLVLSLLGSGVIVARMNAAAQGPPPGYAQENGGWDAPPHEFNDIQRQGFHDGIESAHRDFDHHRTADARDHEEYRHPHVDPNARDAYREGFRRGYDVAMQHLQQH